jgi:hypothetical protein
MAVIKRARSRRTTSINSSLRDDGVRKFRR